MIDKIILIYYIHTKFVYTFFVMSMRRCVCTLFIDIYGIITTNCNVKCAAVKTPNGVGDGSMIRKMMMWGLVVFCLTGCKEDADNESAGSDEGVTVSEALLVGTWSRSDEYGTITFVLNSDGTYVDTYEDSEGYVDVDKGDWYVKEDAIFFSFKNSGETEDDNGNMVPYTDIGEWSETIAVVNDTLYLSAMNRISGQGSELDGTWVIVDDEFGTYTVDGEAEEYREKWSAEIVVKGDNYTMTAGYQDIEGSNSEDDRETSKGGIYTEGDFILFAGADLVEALKTKTIFLGDLLSKLEYEDSINYNGVDYDSDYNIFYGYRVGTDVISFSEPYHRIN